MKIKQALEKSIQGGYDESKRLTSLGIMKGVHEMILDVEFWQALGKSEGWGGSVIWVYTTNCDYTCLDCGLGYKNRNKIPKEFAHGRHTDCPTPKAWVGIQFQFIKNIQQGQDIETAFDNATK